jgi:hypothetical protein
MRIKEGIAFRADRYIAMFMSEISPPEFRGRVGGLYNLNINLGYTCMSLYPRYLL